MTKRWRDAPLDEVLTARQEKPREEDLLSGKVRIVSKISFADGRIQFRSDGHTKTGMILVRPGDLLVSGINAYKGAIAIYDSRAEQPAAATIHYSAYTVSADRADPRFLWYLLRSHVFRENLERAVPGGIKTELKASRLLRVPVTLPPLAEQRRIVARIEELAAKIDEARTLRQKSTEEAEVLIATVVSHILREGTKKGWVARYLADYVLDTCYGTSEKTTDDESGTPILRMGNIQNGRLDLGDLKYLHLNDKDRAKLLLAGGDILVNRTNSAELVGKCAVFNLEGEYAFASYLIRLRLDTMQAEPRLVASYINSPAGRAYMFTERKQMTGQANVNANKLKALPITLPPLPEQRRIVSYLDDLQANVDELKRIQAETATELDALLPSILDKASKGEL